MKVVLPDTYNLYATLEEDLEKSVNDFAYCLVLE
jgi:hypothetical protein